MLRGLPVPWASWNANESGLWRFDTARRIRAAQLEFEGASLYLGKLASERHKAERLLKVDPAAGVEEDVASTAPQEPV